VSGMSLTATAGERSATLAPAATAQVQRPAPPPKPRRINKSQGRVPKPRRLYMGMKPYSAAPSTRRVPHWLCDEGHAWLVVPRTDVVESGAQVSAFSYVSPDGRLAYLEEDRDAAAYLAAAGIEAATSKLWPVRHVPFASCRTFDSYAQQK
jgi:hypothetical protein